MKHIRNAAFAAAFLGLAAGPASAQATAPATPTPSTNLDGKPGTLSDKLSDTNGVIKPSGNVDPLLTHPVFRPSQLVRPREPNGAARETRSGTQLAAQDRSG